MVSGCSVTSVHLTLTSQLLRITATRKGVLFMTRIALKAVGSPESLLRTENKVQQNLMVIPGRLCKVDGTQLLDV